MTSNEMPVTEALFLQAQVLPGNDGSKVICAMLGRGGFGDVALAIDKNTMAYKVVKFFKGLKKKGAEKELNVANMLRPAAINQLLLPDPGLRVMCHNEKGEAKKTFFLTYDSVGVSLSNVLNQNPEGLPSALVKQILRQLLAGLGAMHAAGWVHSDVKADNLLLLLEDVAVDRLVVDAVDQQRFQINMAALVRPRPSPVVHPRNPAVSRKVDKARILHEKKRAAIHRERVTQLKSIVETLRENLATLPQQEDTEVRWHPQPWSKSLASSWLGTPLPASLGDDEVSEYVLRRAARESQGGAKLRSAVQGGCLVSQGLASDQEGGSEDWVTSTGWETIPLSDISEEDAANWCTVEAEGEETPGSWSTVDGGGEETPGSWSTVEAEGEETPTSWSTVEAEGEETPTSWSTVEAEGEETPTSWSTVEAEGEETPTSWSTVEAEGEETPTSWSTVEAEGEETPASWSTVDGGGEACSSGSSWLTLPEESGTSSTQSGGSRKRAYPVAEAIDVAELQHASEVALTREMAPGTLLEASESKASHSQSGPSTSQQASYSQSGPSTSGPLPKRLKVEQEEKVRDLLWSLGSLSGEDEELVPATLALLPDGVTPQLRVKIIDIGLSTEVENNEKMHSPGGTLSYMAPEALVRLKSDLRKVDVWAVYATAFELATGRVPHRCPLNNYNFVRQLHEIAEHRGELPASIVHNPFLLFVTGRFKGFGLPGGPPRLFPSLTSDLLAQGWALRDCQLLLDFLGRAGDLDPDNRATIEELAQHPFLDE